MKEIEGSITSVQNFKASSVSCGIKKNNKKDIALIYSTKPSIAAGVFTTNKALSPTVQVCRENLLFPVARAVTINSGNANACVGNQGYFDAKKITQLTAHELKISSQEVLIASTGIIGKQLPMDKIEQGIPNLVRELDENGGDDAAEGILTTDTFSKTATVEIDIEGTKIRVGGIAKGAGMIHPNMATMLAFLTTDVVIKKNILQKLLVEATEKSFNMISVDGDTSTNDTVIILANGSAKNKILAENSSSLKVFAEALGYITSKLARLIVRDGEGATKLIEVYVKGTNAQHEAQSIAFAIARSNLVKTAFFGEDPNWGRIVASAGTAGVSFDPNKLDLFFGQEQVVKNGVDCSRGRKMGIKNVLKKRDILLTINLNSGNEEAHVLTCDLSLDYVKINALYSS